MPNNVRNNVTLIGSVDEITKFWQMFDVSKSSNIEDRLTKTSRKIQVDEDAPAYKFELDFNKIIPRSEELEIESDGLVMYLESCYGMNHNFQQKIMSTPRAILDSLNAQTIYEFVRQSCPSDIAFSITQDLDRVEDDSRNNFCKAIRNYRKYGYATWYHWSCNYWGTKWNSYNQARTSENAFSFDTAWAHPFPIMIELSKLFSTIVFRVKYADEDIGRNLGHYTIQSGIITYRDDFEVGNPEAQRFACEVHGYDYEALMAERLAEQKSDEDYLASNSTPKPLDSVVKQ